MECYHGTDKEFEHYDLSKSIAYKDFGSGMYLAEEKWHAESVALGKNGNAAYVKIYDLNFDDMLQLYKVKWFKKVSVNWIKFIIESRIKAKNSEYDIVIGPTADARAQDEIEQFYRRHKTRTPSIKEYKELIAKIRPNVYPTQIALLTQAAVNYAESNYIDFYTVK